MTQSFSPLTPARRALITGAPRRVGAAIARHLAKTRYDLILHGRQIDADLERLADELRQKGARVDVVAADLASAEARERLIADAVDQGGALDLLVNNASTFATDRFDDFALSNFDHHFEVNLKAPLDLARHFSRHVSDRHPSIINIIDHRVLKLTPQHFTYTLSKAALHTATITMAQALAPRIRVNAIGPGPTYPNPHEGPHGFTHEVAGVPLRRAVDAQAIAEAVSYLDGALHVTGHLLPVDSGQSVGWETPDIIKDEA